MSKKTVRPKLTVNGPVRLAWLLLLCGLMSSCATYKSPEGEDNDVQLFARAEEIESRVPVDDKKKFNEELTSVYLQFDERLRANKFSGSSRAKAHYYRALMGSRLQTRAIEDGRPVDTVLAKQNLRDFDAVAEENSVIGSSPDLPIAQSIYFAGLVALNELKDESSAMEHFERCAEYAHAGCANVLAHAAEFGRYGQRIDLQKAVSYHKKVVDSGTAYTCAGSYSAVAIARIVFFENVNTPEGDELYWLQISHDLASEMSARSESKTTCGLRGIKVDMYLYQLSRGMPTIALRDSPSRPDSSPREIPVWAIERLLLGKMPQSEFDATISAEVRPVARCSSWFDAAMFFSLQGDEVSKKKYRSLFLTEDAPLCIALRRQLNKLDELSERANKRGGK